MNDVLQIAKDKHARLVAEVEKRMAEIEKLKEFVKFGTELTQPREKTAAGSIAAE